ncbi:MAG: FadR family transcriptional regulator [Proteobacteria bacterium]|nr:FadR family transcriptional regulator [Pseudomonadota bacterium]
MLGELEEGDILPAESALLERFDVSRPTLREALRVLEAESLIVIQRGARGGCRVRGLDVANVAGQFGLLLQHANARIEDVHRARAVVEPGAAREVALLKSRDAAVAALSEILSLEVEATERGEFELRARLSLRFHERVIELAGNHTLTLFTRMIHDIVERHFEVFSRSGTPEASAKARASRAESKTHQQLIELIEAGDPDGAETLWRRHLEGACGVLFRYSDNRALIDLLG